MRLKKLLNCLYILYRPNMFILNVMVKNLKFSLDIQQKTYLIFTKFLLEYKEKPMKRKPNRLKNICQNATLIMLAFSKSIF